MAVCFFHMHTCSMQLYICPAIILTHSQCVNGSDSSVLMALTVRVLMVNGSDSACVNGSDSVCVNGSDSACVNGSDSVCVNGSDSIVYMALTVVCVNSKWL